MLYSSFFLSFLLLHFYAEICTRFSSVEKLKAKVKASDSYIAHLTGTKPDQPRFTIIGSGSWSARASGAAALMRPSIERTNEHLDPRQQLANTPPPQWTTPGLHPVSIHQMAPPERTSDCSLLLIYRTRKDEKLSWSGWDKRNRLQNGLNSPSNIFENLTYGKIEPVDISARHFSLWETLIRFAATAQTRVTLTA